MVGIWGRAGVRCKIKEGWEGAGRQGEAICYFNQCVQQLWVVVKWDDEDDPDEADLHKASGLLIKQPDDDHWKGIAKP